MLFLREICKYIWQIIKRSKKKIVLYLTISEELRFVFSHFLTCCSKLAHTGTYRICFVFSHFLICCSKPAHTGTFRICFVFSHFLTCCSKLAHTGTYCICFVFSHFLICCSKFVIPVPTVIASERISCKFFKS